jgi:hypothetical protein
MRTPGLLAVAAAACVLAAGCSTAPAGFHDPSVLARSIRTFTDNRLINPLGDHYDPGVDVTKVSCIPDGVSTDTCLIDYSDGGAETVTAVISADGTRWITRQQ